MGTEHPEMSLIAAFQWMQPLLGTIDLMDGSLSLCESERMFSGDSKFKQKAL